MGIFKYFGLRTNRNQHFMIVKTVIPLRIVRSRTHRVGPIGLGAPFYLVIDREFSSSYNPYLIFEC